MLEIWKDLWKPGYSDSITSPFQKWGGKGVSSTGAGLIPPHVSSPIPTNSGQIPDRAELQPGLHWGRHGPKLHQMRVVR